MDHKNELKSVLNQLNAQSCAFKKFQDYHSLLLDWNRRVNLISKQDERRIVLRHFIDSLTLLKAIPFPKNIRVLDLGTGAGFPGVPLKIIRPDIHLTLLESNRKKGLFLKQLILNLNLRKIKLFIGRAENLVSEIDPVDMICSRAVTKINTLLQWSIPYIKPSGGNLIALKGLNGNAELQKLPNSIHTRNIYRSRWIALTPFPDILPNLERYMIQLEFDETCS